MIWIEDFYNVTDWDQIGVGDSQTHPEQFPPFLSSADSHALNWFNKNATEFAKEYNITSHLMNSLKLSDSEREIFLLKMDKIYHSKLNIMNQELKRRN